LKEPLELLAVQLLALLLLLLLPGKGRSMHPTPRLAVHIAERMTRGLLQPVCAAAVVDAAAEAAHNAQPTPLLFLQQR
jgi:hypothetical protein